MSYCDVQTCMLFQVVNLEQLSSWAKVAHCRVREGLQHLQLPSPKSLLISITLRSTASSRVSLGTRPLAPVPERQQGIGRRSEGRVRGWRCRSSWLLPSESQVGKGHDPCRKLHSLGGRLLLPLCFRDCTLPHPLGSNAVTLPIHSAQGVSLVLRASLHPDCAVKMVPLLSPFWSFAWTGCLLSAET